MLSQSGSCGVHERSAGPGASQKGLRIAFTRSRLTVGLTAGVTSGAENAIERAQAAGWTVVSLKNDWDKVF